MFKELSKGLKQSATLTFVSGIILGIIYFVMTINFIIALIVMGAGMSVANLLAALAQILDDLEQTKKNTEETNKYLAEILKEIKAKNSSETQTFSNSSGTVHDNGIYDQINNSPSSSDAPEQNLKPLVVDGKTLCPVCGTPNRLNALRCSNCKYKLRANSDVNNDDSSIPWPN